MHFLLPPGEGVPLDIGVDGVRDVGKDTMEAQLPGPGLRVVWKVDGRIRLKIELGCMWGVPSCTVRWLSRLF